MMRRLCVGLLVVVGLAVLIWVRPGARQAQAQPTEEIHTAEAVGGGGNEEDAVARYRAGGSRHWRQVMIGHR